MSQLQRAAWAGLVISTFSCGRPNTSGEETFATESEALTVCPGGSTVKGLDVSSYQGVVDWAAVAGSGIKFAYAKATESTDWTDPTFPGNWSGIKAHGMLRGAYHFFHPGVDGKDQADFFLSYAEQGAGDLPPVLDWEVSDKVSGETAAVNAKAFIDEIKARTGRPTIVYTSPGLWDGFGVPDSFAADTMFVADYIYCDTGGCCPLMPNGWNAWGLWQWDDKGSVPGIDHAVDLDLFNGDEAALEKLAGTLSSGGTTGGGSGSTGPVCKDESAIGHGIGQGSRKTGCSGGTKPKLPPKPILCGVMQPGEGLGVGDTLASCDGRFGVTLQSDGNTVLSSSNIPLWATGTNGEKGYLFTMQTDGNLVLYSSDGCALWASNTNGNPGARVISQTDGNLVVYTAKGKALWSSGTGPIGATQSACGVLEPGHGLAPGQWLAACGGCFGLTMQGDGNLVLYDQQSKALWSSKTNGKHGFAFNMETDGNATLYASDGCPLWDSNTPNRPKSTFHVQDDGNLVVYDADNKAVWSSHTDVCNGGCTCGAF